MKFSIGYRLCSDDNFIDSIIKRKDSVSEVYFSWGDFANGRNNQIKHSDMTPWQAQAKQINDLEKLTKEGIWVNLLLNATCYGKDSQSRAFFEKIGECIDYLQNNFLLKSVTTASPLIAKFIKNNFENIDVRASVNMCIGTIEGMEYVAHLFDSFYMKRELNRDFDAIKTLKNWCDKNGKKLYALANSGCLNNCSAHTFHDNLVSHESEISMMDNGYAFEGICHFFLKNEQNIHRLADYTGFIRPEDIYLYEGVFPAIKLATRVNSNPERIFRAYIDNQKYIGSVLDLLEPNHTGTIRPYFLENSLIEARVENNKLNYNTDKALIKLKEDIYANE
ncbi:MAG: hypothetical protein E7410_06505 [Ruminococcaceae bacterium]|nr:hypothetical protein [Oscillospiraceae bacterium]